VVHREHRLEDHVVALCGDEVEGALDAGTPRLLSVSVLVDKLQVAEADDVLIILVEDPLGALGELLLRSHLQVGRRSCAGGGSLQAQG